MQKLRNNTFEVGNVLLSEGITPHLPIYLVTRLSAEELQSLRKYSPMNTFFEIYTVVTKEMILSDADTNDWVAIDFALGCTEDQRIFICIQGCYKKTEI